MAVNKLEGQKLKKENGTAQCRVQPKRQSNTGGNNMLKLGLIGYGTIGGMLADAIREGKVGEAQLVAVHDLFDESPFPAGDGQPAYLPDFDTFLQQEKIGRAHV